MQKEIAFFFAQLQCNVRLSFNFFLATTASGAMELIPSRGKKFFELSNHLGNVLVTISDRKIMMLPDDQGCTAGTANDILNVYTRNNEPSYVARQEVNILDGFESFNDDDFVAYTDNSLGTCAVIDPANPPAGSYYRADVVTANDYYPFGMLMPGRKYSIANTNYRYGFNGKEKSNEIISDDYDYGARIYGGRIGRWLSVDPLQQKYTDLSSYQYCANSPISAKDPDGRLIIFINGLWTAGTDISKPLEPYWGEAWVRQAQDRIGDHAQPRFYDGSLGGAAALILYNGMTNSASFRASEGKNQGYADASTIIKNLSSGETIKIITNSMGTAFARGFTKGILQYQSEENGRREAVNEGIDQQIGALKGDNSFLRMNIKTKSSSIPQITPYTAGEKKALAQIVTNNTKIAQLESSKKQLLNVQFESETDLSSHQIDYANPDVKFNYYMTTDNFSLLEKAFVKQKAIKGATNLGKMSVHHSSGANPSSLPPSSSPDPKKP